MDLSSNNPNRNPTTLPNAWHRYTDCSKGGDVGGSFSDARPMCSCPAGQMYPPGGPVWGGPVCVPDTCPVDPLPDFPTPTTDACSASLEARLGLADPAVCPRIPVMEDKNGEPCLKKKLGDLGVPYAGPTSTIRTPAYQAHLKDVWDKWWEHGFVSDPTLYQACTARRTIVENEKNKHGISYDPIGTSHNEGKAFDISRATVDRVPDVSGMLRQAPACNLRWGGDYRDSPPDAVHFYTP